MTQGNNMISGGLDFQYLLLENYKDLNLSEEEVTTILMIKHFIELGNPFVNADLLSLKMSLKVQQIDKILANLLTRGYIEYISRGKETVTTLEPLENKLFRQYQMFLTKEESRQSQEKLDNSLTNIYGEFQKLLNRSLAPIELSKIREWVAHGYSDEMIINALKEALSKGKKSLRSVDKILLSWETREDIEKEGVSSLSESWKNNIEETYRIAKTPWVDIDDDEEK